MRKRSVGINVRAQIGGAQVLHLLAVDDDISLVRALQHIDAAYQR